MDNIFLPIESKFVDSQSRFRLAILAGQRAKQIIEGDKPVLQCGHSKATTIAIEEILGGDLKIFYGKEAVRHSEEAARIRKEKKSQYLSPEREEELKREIKKDLSLYLHEKELSVSESIHQETEPSE